MNDRRIDNRAGCNLDATTLQMNVHRLQDGPAQVMLFQKMAELADRGLVGHGFVAEIDSR